MPEPNILTAQDLVKRFDGVTAVDGVSFTVGAGEVAGLLGPNGAGKTTTLRMLAGILTPTAGRVLVNGSDLHANAIAAKQRIGFLSGDTQLYQRLTPREVFFYFGRLYRVPESELRQRIEQQIEELEMAAFADRPCRTLSSGQKQRANIARAFLHDPDVLILDEPTAALDIVSGRFIVEAIRRKRAAGRAVLFSTHIMGEAEHLCDRILFINEGRITDSGRLDELLARTGAGSLADAFLSSMRSGTAPIIRNQA
jgi:sodium transport system ATP-binding protein